MPPPSRVLTLARRRAAAFLQMAVLCLALPVSSWALSSSRYVPPLDGSVLCAPVVQRDGRLLVGGYFNLVAPGNPVRHLVRLNPEGSLDTSFAPVLNGQVRCLAVLEDGDMLVGGEFTEVNGQPRNRLARLNQDGTLDTDFDVNVNGTVDAILMEDSGTFLIGGRFTQVAAEPRLRLARLQLGGAVVPGFSPQMNNDVRALAALPGGQILIGGRFTKIGTLTCNGLARLQGGDGSVDTSFAPGSAANPYEVSSLAVRADGSILAGVYTSSSPTYIYYSVIVLDAAGTVQTTRGATDRVTFLLPQTNGQTVFGGAFEAVYSSTYSVVNGLSRLNPGPGNTIDASLEGSSQITKNMSGTFLPDGSLVAGGVYSGNGGGRANALLWRRGAEASSQSLTVSETGQITWLRGGKQAEVEQVRFSVSADGGHTWTDLGLAQPVAGGWQLQPAAPMPPAGDVRAVARVRCGHYRGSSGLFETVASFGGAAPDIEVVDFNGTVLQDAAGTVDFGSTRTAQTFTIRNTGTGALKLGELSFYGLHPADYLVETTGMDTFLPTGAQTTFTVILKPTSPGTRRVGLRIPSNDSDESVFDVSLLGAELTGSDPAPNTFRVYEILSNQQQAPTSRAPTPAYSPAISEFTYAIPQNTTQVSVQPLFLGLNGATGLYAPGVGITFRLNGTDLPIDTSFVPVTLGPAASQVVTLDIIAIAGVSEKRLLLTFNRAAPAPGNLDLAFRPAAVGETTNNSVYALAVEPEGTVLVGGALLDSQRSLVRLTPDGQVSPDLVPVSGGIQAVSREADSLHLAGIGLHGIEGISYPGVSRVSLAGVRDTSFAPFTPQGSPTINSFLRLPDGKVLIGGQFTKVNGVDRMHFARLNADGTLDPAFNASVSGRVETMYLLPDGRYLLGGSLGVVNHIGAGLACLNPDGSNSPAFLLAEPVYCIVRQPDGRYLFGGSFGLVRRMADGSVDTSFKPNVQGPVKSIVLQADGAIVVAGEFTTVANVARRSIARLKPPLGALDTTFNPNAANSEFVNSTVYGLALQADGKLLAGGRFSESGGQRWVRLARFHNNAPAAETLTATDSGHAQWLRGGSAPEFQTVTFEYSTDGGTTWASAGAGTPTAGGWSAAILMLPTAGKLRGTGTASSGQNNLSWSRYVSQTVDFSFGPPELEVANADTEAPMQDGATVTFPQAALGLNVVNYATLAISNSGQSHLTPVTATLDGPDAAMFAIVEPPSVAVGPERSTTVKVSFKPTTLGVKTSVLHITSNDPDEPSFGVTLTGTGVPETPPGVTTLSALQTGVKTIQLRGEANAKGNDRLVWFDHGPTTALGSTAAATPATISGSGFINVTAVVGDVAPHAPYYHRVRAEGTLGAAAGEVKSITLNTAPAAVADTFYCFNSSTHPFTVLSNDMDADGDSLTITSFTQPLPASSGKVVKTAAGIEFIATATFASNPPAKFSYTISDGFGGTATAEVTLLPGSVNVDPPLIEAPSYRDVFRLNVSCDSNSIWIGRESLSWVSFSYNIPRAGSGQLEVIVDGNPGKTSRSAFIQVGDKQVEIIQAAVSEAPVITHPIGPLLGMLSSPFFEFINVEPMPATLTASGLPPGLKLQLFYGSWTFQGRPTKTGAFTIKLQARNAVGTSPPATIPMTISPLPPGAAGSHLALLEPDARINDGTLPSRLEITTTAAGGASGRLITGTTVQPFTGYVWGTPLDLRFSHIEAKVPKKGAAPVNLLISMTHADDTLLMSVRDPEDVWAPILLPGSGWTNRWSKTRKATAYAAPYRFYLDQPDTTATLPQGAGIGAFSVLPDTGVAAITGRLADGSTFTTSGFISLSGDILVYQSLYGAKSTLANVLKIQAAPQVADNTLGGTLSWIKPATAAKVKDVVYRSGFGPVTLTVKGGAYPVPAVGSLVMGLPPGPNNALLDFNLGLLNPAGDNFSQLFTLSHPKGTKLVNAATFPAPNLNLKAVKMTTFNAATGAFTGEFTLPGATKALNRKSVFHGQIVKQGGTVEGHGFYLLPGVPEAGQTVLTAPQNSGKVRLLPAPAP